MANLKEFLKEQAATERTQSVEREEVRREWCESVSRLLDMLVGWLKEADSEMVLKIERTVHQIHESRIGLYQVEGLRLTLGTREIRIVPVSRYSIGSFAGVTSGSSVRDGRVDMTNVEKKYMLIRNRNEQGEHWLIVDDRDYIARSLDRPTFEAAVLSMLQ